jgi:hypothetical protein
MSCGAGKSLYSNVLNGATLRSALIKRLLAKESSVDDRY